LRQIAPLHDEATGVGVDFSPASFGDPSAVSKNFTLTPLRALTLREKHRG
jgi:hypothetical protein